VIRLTLRYLARKIIDIDFQVNAVKENTRGHSKWYLFAGYVRKPLR